MTHPPADNSPRAPTIAADVDDGGGTDDPGSCWSCGYALRGLGADTRRCPDCGRAFDPADPGSTNRLRPVGAVARRLLLPPGWPTVLLALVAAVLVVVGTGGTAGFHVQFDDLPLLRYTFTDRDAWAETSVRWRVYATGVAVAAAVALWAVARATAWGVFVARHRPPADLRRGRNGTAAVVALLLGFCGVWVVCGGSPRIGREWADALLRAPVDPATGYPAYVQSPVSLSDTQRRSVIRALLLDGDTPRHRRAGVSLFCLYPTIGEPAVLREAAAREADADVLALELRVLGMFRDPQLLPFVEPYLRDPRPPVRAAAADAVGMTHMTAYQTGIERTSWVQPTAVVPGNPPVRVDALLLRGSSQMAVAYTAPQEWDPLESTCRHASLSIL